MSMIYDNWERLVTAVLKKERLWQLFHDQSRSPSISSESSGLSFSFGCGSSIEDAPFSSPEWSASKQKGNDDFGTKTAASTSSSTLVEDQSLGNLTRNKKLTFTRSWKRALKIEVPKLQPESHVACNRAQDTSEYCRNISPRMGSPTSSSRVHPRAGGGHNKPQTNWPDEAKQKGHPLPLPPVAISSSSPVSRLNSAAISPTLPSHSPERAGNLKSPGTLWKKGKLLGRGALGDIYLGFDSEKGEMCAMKEVKLFSDDAMSKQGAMQLEIELTVLSQLRHPNIVQYYGAEVVGDNLYIYSEYVSGGSISRILQEYGKLGESAIRSYTHQILSGLAYLHSRWISHRDIKAVTILLDPNGRIKLGSFGIEKHIIGQSHPSLLRESPYWMAPEVIMNPSVRNPAIDIWSLGCTVLEIATSEPPMSQFKQEVAMLKVAYHKELPMIPDHLSDDCKDFVRHCLQWNPKHRATAAQLLEHPFVKSSSPSQKQILVSTSSAHPAVPNAGKPEEFDHARSSHHWDSRRLANHFSRASRVTFRQGFPISPLSPVGSPLLHPRSPQLLNGRLSLPSIPTSSTLISGGIGDTSYTHFNQSMLRQENRQSPKQSPTDNSPSYWDPAILQGLYSGFHDFQELAAASDQELLGGAANGQLYGQPMLVDRVSHQLSNVSLKLNPSRHLDPSSPSPSFHIAGV
ncbi:mitogen-activated protein kinase kinase kinase YODA-like isoform X2 [Sesamum indicum]|uniref:Mitogen-activated protein kinase kinase kinase YODA-like isoform X2 n=1 Tax=Sesamum indicum TaxID=4182 RepID=A0A6I9SZ56_SESIN|nr:mitogen-activated protein kinase kinase kinase YODA-like isoform X2 [Sesamum indicum]